MSHLPDAGKEQLHDLPVCFLDDLRLLRHIPAIFKELDHSQHNCEALDSPEAPLFATCGVMASSLRRPFWVTTTGSFSAAMMSVAKFFEPLARPFGLN
ncbi:MAG: hypothetical protein WBW81_03800 [Methylocella sp.]